MLSFVIFFFGTRSFVILFGLKLSIVIYHLILVWLVVMTIFIY